MPHNVFEGNTYKYILKGIDVALRYRVARLLRTKKSSKVAFVQEAIYKKGGVFKYPTVFQCDNGPEFKKMKRQSCLKNTLLKSEGQQPSTSISIPSLTKLLFKPIDDQELQDSEKISTIWVKNLNKIVKKMNNTKSSMIDMKPKDVIKLGTVPLDETYPEETVLTEDGLYRYLYQSGEQHGDQKRQATDFIWSTNT